MTASDISLAAQGRQDRNKEFAQVLAWIVYNGAALTGVAVNDPKKIPQIRRRLPKLV